MKRPCHSLKCLNQKFGIPTSTKIRKKNAKSAYPTHSPIRTMVFNTSVRPTIFLADINTPVLEGLKILNQPTEKFCFVLAET